MFLQYFGLREEPFGNAPDPRFVPAEGPYGLFLSQLLRGFDTGTRLQIFAAPEGLGKTTILRAIAEKVQTRAQVVFINDLVPANPGFLAAIARTVGFTPPPDSALDALRRSVDNFFKEQQARCRGVLLLVDDAQHLDNAAIVELGGLLHRTVPAVRIILAGTPGVKEFSQHPALAYWRNVEPLAMDSLDAAGTATYIAHRLAIAGRTGSTVFAPNAIQFIAESSGGLPESINRICSDALMKAYTLGKTVVDRNLIDEPVDYTELARSLDRVINMGTPAAKSEPAAPPRTSVPERSSKKEPSSRPAAAQTPGTFEKKEVAARAVSATPQSSERKEVASSVTSALAPPQRIERKDLPLLSTIQSWLAQKAAIWTGTASELLSGLREINPASFETVAPRELTQLVDDNILVLKAHGIHAEIRSNPTGPRLIALKRQLAPTAVPNDSTAPEEPDVRKIAG